MIILLLKILPIFIVMLLVFTIFIPMVDNVIDCNQLTGEFKEQCESVKSTTWMIALIIPVAIIFLMLRTFSMFEFDDVDYNDDDKKTAKSPKDSLPTYAKILLKLKLAKIKETS